MSTLKWFFIYGRDVGKSARKLNNTINNAYAFFEENLKGSIEPGKFADLAVLSHDILTFPEDMIKEIKVLMTIVDGKIVYENEEMGKQI